ncbi:hypothetical protein BJ165DRAFT_1445191 [Panaeolus papilionaceus]|nr:hypothetical protein BJ165DRAFT_1445191 [Panaeolus papilionaceus]
MTARTDLLAQAKAQKVETSEASSSTKGNSRKPPAKKRKTAAKGPPTTALTTLSKTDTPATEPQFKGKRRNAKLAHITEMPLDILFEIFGFLHPLDLLYLARANKVLRGVVMSRQALGVWKKLPAYKKLATLTDKEWIKIKDDVLSVFAYRKQRSDYEGLRRQYSTSVQVLHQWLLKIYAQSASRPLLFPTSADVAKSEPFRTLIQDAADTTFPLVEEQLQTLQDNVTDIITTWNNSAMQLLVDLLPAPPKRSKLTGEERLSLATTFFKCHWCTEPISYPRILMHSCVRNRRIQVNGTEGESTEVDSEKEGDEENKCEADDQQTPRVFIDSSPEAMWKSMSEWYGSQWNEGGEQITFDDEASQVARNILLACNYPPETTPTTTVDNDVIRMECTRCYKTSKKPQRLIMNWKQAISHDLKKHFTDGPSPSGWKLVVDEHDLATVREKEATQEAKGRYICKRCATLQQEYNCRAHTIFKHEISRDTLPAKQREFIETYYTPDIDQIIQHSLPLPVKL